MMKMIDVKQTLAEALIELSKHKSIERITVSDIVKECHTSRRTFYNHFIDKYDLIAWIYTSREEKILSCFNHTDSWEECMRHTYAAFLENTVFFSNIIDQEGQNSFYQQLSLHAYSYMKETILSSLQTEQIPEDIDYALTAHVFGQVNCIARWIREGFLISPEQMAAYNVQNMPPLIRRFFLKPE